jgi:tripartite-type tricarboxylate transporter receptor subunit TctC
VAGLAAPAGLPADARAKLRLALAETMKDREIREQLVANGLEPAFEPAEAVAALRCATCTKHLSAQQGKSSGSKPRTVPCASSARSTASRYRN